MVTKIKIFENFDKIEIIYDNYWKNSIFWKFWPKSRLKIYREFQDFLTEIKIFENFDQNWDYLQILPESKFSFFFFTKIEIISENADKNRNFRAF